uniref:C-type lectin domain-containing protein n=1 Tax=Nothoprocta perdicaria TaxID=30464 RepID=A0A8C7EH56_NOTPE
SSTPISSLPIPSPLRAGCEGCSSPAELGASSSCPSHWLSYRGHCYGYFTQRKTWQQAEKECERYGPRGHLASVHTFPERKVLAKYVAQHLQPGNVWIGLHDEEHQERSWKWSDNSVLSFQGWAQGQPDNVNDNEDCVVLDSDSRRHRGRCGDKAVVDTGVMDMEGGDGYRGVMDMEEDDGHGGRVIDGVMDTRK